MPELPDLQVFSRNLDKKLSGKKLVTLNVFVDKKLNVPSAELKRNLEGQTLDKVEREGKGLHFVFSNQQVLGLHLMLKGQLQLFKEKNQFKNKIIELVFEDENGIALSDFMGAATPTLNPPHADVPDALSDEIGFSFLKNQFSKAKVAVKGFLLDQKKIRGIGNAYADEILWEAGISPFSICNKIPEDKLKKLAKAIKSVLHDAEKQILKSNPDLITGEIRDFLKVHTSKKTHSPTGAEIHSKDFKSRITYYTDEQELFE